MKVYVLYCDYGGSEGCSAPEDVTVDEAKAIAWRDSDRFGYQAYSEFEIQIPAGAVGATSTNSSPSSLEVNE